MAGTKYVMVMHDAFLLPGKFDLDNGRNPLSLSRSIQQRRLVQNSSSRIDKRKLVVMSQLKGKQITPTKVEEGIKLTALVAVRNSNQNMAFANEIVDSLVSMIMPSRGCLVLQLVSTQLDPSNSLSLSKFI